MPQPIKNGITTGIAVALITIAVGLVITFHLCQNQGSQGSYFSSLCILPFFWSLVLAPFTGIGSGLIIWKLIAKRIRHGKTGRTDTAPIHPAPVNPLFVGIPWVVAFAALYVLEPENKLFKGDSVFLILLIVTAGTIIIGLCSYLVEFGTQLLYLKLTRYRWASNKPLAVIRTLFRLLQTGAVAAYVAVFLSTA